MPTNAIFFSCAAFVSNPNKFLLALNGITLIYDAEKDSWWATKNIRLLLDNVWTRQGKSVKERFA